MIGEGDSGVPEVVMLSLRLKSEREVKKRKSWVFCFN